MKERLRFDVPGMELKIKLNSAEARRKGKLEIGETINVLLAELITDEFAATVTIKEENDFSISVSRIPNPNVKSYLVTVDIGVFKMLYDGLYVVLSNNSIFSGFGHSFGQFEIPTLEVPNWNTLELLHVDKIVFFHRIKP